MKTFNVNDFDHAREWFEHGVQAAARRALVATGARLINHITTDIIPATEPTPVDRGMYRAGWMSKATNDGVEVSNSTPHAPMIEWGVRAGRLKIGGAIGPLTAWVKRKIGAGSDAEARRIAWAIAVKLQREGIFNKGKGLRVLERATERVQEFFTREFKREMQRGI